MAAADLEYHVVDVFTDRPFAGNPLAVVLGAEGLPTAALQSLAREFHLSETAFPLEPGAAARESGVDYQLRIFTPEVELPFAGHPSVGTAWLMARLGRVTPGRAVQRCGAGDLPLEIAPDGGPVRLTGAEPSASEPVDPAAALEAVGLGPDDLDGRMRVCGTGVPFAVLPVRADSLARCAPDLGRLSSGFAAPHGPATGVYVVVWSPGPSSARARMFAGDIGIAEDPATGSAALALGAWLAAEGLAATDLDYEVLQGAEMGRPSTMSCRVEVADGRAVRVHVTGRVAPVAHGRVAVPAAG